MKRFKTVKAGVTFFLDYDCTVEIIKKRRPHLLDEVDPLPMMLTTVLDNLCCEYLDGLEAMDIWDYFESAIICTAEPPSSTEVVED